MYNIRRNPFSSRYKGEKSELEAIYYLAYLGYGIICHGYSVAHLSEVDILSYGRGCLVAVEVKSCLTNSAEYIELSKWVDYKKKEKIKRAIMYFLSKNDIPFCSLRLDVIYITKNRITHYRGVSLY